MTDWKDKLNESFNLDRDHAAKKLTEKEVAEQKAKENKVQAAKFLESTGHEALNEIATLMRSYSRQSSISDNNSSSEIMIKHPYSEINEYKFRVDINGEYVVAFSNPPGNNYNSSKQLGKTSEVTTEMILDEFTDKFTKYRASQRK